MKIKLLIVSLLCCAVMHGQSNDAEAAIYNVGLGAVIGTIGAIINKKPDQKLGKVITKSLWQGAVGGYLNFESKRVLRENAWKEDWKLYWAANALNSIGASITENVANNRGMLSQINYNLGMVRVEFITGDTFKVRPKLMPLSTISFLSGLRYKFEAKETLKTGQFIFSTPQLDPVNGYNHFEPAALCATGYIIIERESINEPKLKVHEIVHRYQEFNYIGINAFYRTPIENALAKFGVGRFVNRYLYVEYHLIPINVYHMFMHNYGTYNSNIFEKEAMYYGGR